MKITMKRQQKTRKSSVKCPTPPSSLRPISAGGRIRAKGKPEASVCDYGYNYVYGWEGKDELRKKEHRENVTKLRERKKDMERDVMENYFNRYAYDPNSNLHYGSCQCSESQMYIPVEKQERTTIFYSEVGDGIWKVMRQ